MQLRQLLLNHKSFKIKIGNSISKREILLFNKTYEERTEKFQQMISDRSVKVIMYTSSGYSIDSTIAGSRNIL